jgi:hypothetical protein
MSKKRTMREGMHRGSASFSEKESVSRHGIWVLFSAWHFSRYKGRRRDKVLSQKASAKKREKENENERKETDVTRVCCYDVFGDRKSWMGCEKGRGRGEGLGKSKPSWFTS